MHPARLEIFAVRATRYFQISPALARSRRPHFNVIALGGSKSQVAGAKLDYSIMQAEELQHAFGVGRKRLELFVRFLRRCDFHQFYFVELVHPDDATRLAARRTGFST